MNRKKEFLNETLITKGKILESNKENLPEGVLCRVTYPICNIDVLNHNGRKYSKEVWEKVHESKEINEKLETRTLFGHAEHPKETQSNLEKTSHIVSRMYQGEDIFEGKKVLVEYADFDVLDTPYGRIVDTLLRADCGVGVSTRAEGELEEATDEDGTTYQKVLPESYRFVTVDFTADPSTLNVKPMNIQRQVLSDLQKGVEEHTMPEEDVVGILESVGTKESKQLLEKIKEAQFGSVEWQEEQIAKIKQKIENGEELDGADKAFMETQLDHNKRLEIEELQKTWDASEKKEKVKEGLSNPSVDSSEVVETPDGKVTVNLLKDTLSDGSIAWNISINGEDFYYAQDQKDAVDVFGKVVKALKDGEDVKSMGNANEKKNITEGVETVSGTYGSGHTPCDVYVYTKGDLKWYVCDGSVNVNATYDEIEDGVDVETLSDVDMFTASEPITSEEELEAAVDDDDVDDVDESKKIEAYKIGDWVSWKSHEGIKGNGRGKVIDVYQSPQGDWNITAKNSSETVALQASDLRESKYDTISNKKKVSENEEEKVDRVQQIADSFINGNISWARDQINGDITLFSKVYQYLKSFETGESELKGEADRFMRLMSESKSDEKESKKILESFGDGNFNEWVKTFQDIYAKMEEDNKVALKSAIFESSEDNFSTMKKKILDLELQEAGVRADKEKLEEALTTIKKKYASDSIYMSKKLKDALETVKERSNTIETAKKKTATTIKGLLAEKTSMEKKYKEQVDTLNEEISAVETKMKRESIKHYIKGKINSSKLSFHQNSLALLENCESVEEVDALFIKLRDAIREGIAHSAVPKDIKISEHIDKEQSKLDSAVGSAFQGMN